MLPVLRRNRTIPAGWDLFDLGWDFDRLLGGKGGGGTTLGTSSFTGWSPAVDVRETENEFLVSAELPGLNAEDVDVTVENGVLSLTGEKKEEFAEEDQRSGRQVWERRYGRFERKFSLPRGVDGAKVSAKFADGVLNIALPKAATAKARKIKIAS